MPKPQNYGPCLSGNKPIFSNPSKNILCIIFNENITCYSHKNVKLEILQPNYNLFGYYFLVIKCFKKREGVQYVCIYVLTTVCDKAVIKVNLVKQMGEEVIFREIDTLGIHNVGRN